MNVYFLVLMFVLLNITSQCFFKLGVVRVNHFSELNLYHSGIYLISAGVIAQVVGVVTWLFILNYKGLAWAGIMASLIPISLVFTGKFVFNEHFDGIMLIGVGFVFVGLLVVNYSEFPFLR